MIDERGKVSDERRKVSDEMRRQVSEKAKEEGREKLSQFIRKEIVYPHLLQVRSSIPISFSFFFGNFLVHAPNPKIQDLQIIDFL